MAGRSWNQDGIVHTIIDDDAPTAALRLLEPLIAKFEPSDNQDIELEIEFNSRGYYDAGSMYGGRDRMGSAPEGEDERTLVGMTLYGPGNDGGIPVPPEIAQQLFDVYYDDIERAELEDQDDYPEHDDYDNFYESRIIRDVSRLITEDPDVFDQ